MPVFQTGNPLWDQGLNAGATGLAGLFDQSRAAQAGYYGAETGKALLEAQKLRYQQGKMEGLEGDLAGVFGPNGAAPLSAQPVAPTAPVAAPAPAPPMAAASTTSSPSPLATTVAPDPWGGAPTPDPVPGPAPGLAPAPAPAVTPTPTAGAGFIQAPGGGVKQAPPARANGSAAPPVDLSRIVIHAIQGGAQPEQIAHMAGAILNGMVLSGRLDRPTANAMMASMGAPSAYVADVQGQTSRATTAMTQAGETQRTGMASQHVIRVSDGAEMDVPLAELNAHPDLYRHYDSARAIQGDTPEPVSVNGQPGYSQRRNMARPGVAPLSESTPVQMVPVGGGPARLVSPAEVRANPGAWRPAQTSDVAVKDVVGPTGPMSTTAAETLNAPGVTPLPAGTDQGNAQATAMLMDALRNGDLAKGQSIISAMQTAQAAQVPKQVITPDQQAKMEADDLSYFANLYPPPSGANPKTSTLPAAPRPDQLAYFAGLKRILTRKIYRDNPAAAGPAAWEMMRAAGIIPKDASDRKVGVQWMAIPGQQGEFPNITGGKADEQRIYIGDETTLPKDKNGNWDYSKLVGSLGAPSLTDTVAPKPAASGTSLGKPLKSLGAATGLADGPFTDKTTGKKYTVQGGQLYAAPGP